MMWRCFKCETFNNGQNCFICGTDKNTPPPRIPIAPPDQRMYRGPVGDGRNRGTYVSPESGESKAWIPILVILGIVIFVLLMVIISSL